MKFKISDKLSLPREAITWVISFISKRGAGKTYCASVLAEEMLKNKIPIIVIDAMGIWWGLRVGKDGKGDGLPIVVFGGEHADIPLDPMKSKQIAKAIVETNISAVLDLSELSKAQTRRIVAEFLDELYKINRVERHVFIEESDIFAPQRTFGIEQEQCLGAMDNFVRRGGNHNLGCSLITQRSAVLNKNLLTQSDCLIILRTLAPQDKKAIQAWVEEQTDEDRTKLKEWYDSLKSLKNGEAYCWHPEDPKIFKKIMFRKRETFHATRLFLLSRKSETIKLMEVGEFVRKFKDKFEPKPKEIPKPIISAKPVEVSKATEPYRILKSAVIQKPPQKIIDDYKKEKEKYLSKNQPTQPVIPEYHEKEESEITVRKTEPMIILQKLKPTITVMSEPTTPLGKVIVVLTEDRPDRWTITKIKAKISEHAWDNDGVDAEIKRLIQWEILAWQSNHYIRFYPDRVRVVEVPVELDENA